MISPKVRPLIALALTLLALTTLFAPTVLAQTAAPATATPAPTRTPAPTPTATSTLTARQGQLLLAQAFLDGGEYGEAAKGFAKIAELNPGDPTAVPGLKAALKAQATATAAASAPKPTAAPATTPSPTFGRSFGGQLSSFASTGLAALILILLVYFLSRLVRWVLIQLREAWWTQTQGIFGLIRKAAVLPGYYVAEFIDATGDATFPAGKVVTQALTELLVQWKQAVRPDLPAVEPAPSLELSGMGWVKVLWGWILPPPRIYKLSGALLGRPGGPYRLAISRTSLAKNQVDLSQTLGPAGGSPVLPDQAIRDLATQALAWLIDPAGATIGQSAIEQGRPVAKGLESTERGLTGAPPRTASQVIQDAMRLIGVARQQVSRKPVDNAAVQHSLAEAEQALAALPADSTLRGQLQAAINELRGRIR